MTPNLRSPAVPFLDPDAVARVLSPRTVVTTEPLGGSWAPVARVTLDDGSTVVVKERRRHGGGWGYDPANLRNERAALEVLAAVSGVAGESTIGPRLVAGDDAAGVVVMTDVGRGPTLEERLLDPSGGAAAVEGLVELGRVLGRLHAATAGPASDGFVRRRAALGGPYDPVAERLRYVIHDLPVLWREVGDHADALGFTPPRGTDRDVEELWRSLAEPGPFLALTHLDPNPQNCVLVDGGARLVDYEGAGVRHLGQDAAFVRFPFPNYGRWAVLPPAVQVRMEDAYRSTLVEGGVVAAADDAAYARAMAVGCATTVVLRIHRLRKIADDEDATEARRRRTQMVSAIGVFAAAAEEAGCFPALAAWFVGLGEEMRARWADANAAPREYPALPLREEVAR